MKVSSIKYGNITILVFCDKNKELFCSQEDIEKRVKTWIRDIHLFYLGLFWTIHTSGERSLIAVLGSKLHWRILKAVQTKSRRRGRQKSQKMSLYMSRTLENRPYLMRLHKKAEQPNQPDYPNREASTRAINVRPELKSQNRISNIGIEN